MTEFTKGPWEIIYNGPRIIQIGPLAADAYYVSAWLSVSEQDAHLIAAAPDLYHALEKCLDVMVFTEGGEPLSFSAAIEEAKQALKKAGGE